MEKATYRSVSVVRFQTNANNVDPELKVGPSLSNCGRRNLRRDFPLFKSAV
jgi:hypothetical protein